MRKMIRLIMFICLASAVTNLYAGPSEKRFEGEWVSHKDVDFGIHLHQDGNRLTGYHSAVTKYGSRTDTAVDGEGALLPFQSKLKATPRSLTFTALIQMQC